MLIDKKQSNGGAVDFNMQNQCGSAIKKLLIEAYQKTIKEVQNADGAFQRDPNIYVDDPFTKSEYLEQVREEFEANHEAMEKVQNLSDAEVLDYIFFANTVNSQVVDNNEKIFFKILDLLIKHLDLICIGAKKGAYLKNAIHLCNHTSCEKRAVRSGFEALKERFEHLLKKCVL